MWRTEKEAGYVGRWGGVIREKRVVLVGERMKGWPQGSGGVGEREGGEGEG